MQTSDFSVKTPPNLIRSTSVKLIRWCKKRNDQYLLRRFANNRLFLPRLLRMSHSNSTPIPEQTLNTLVSNKHNEPNNGQIQQTLWHKTIVVREHVNTAKWTEPLRVLFEEGTNLSCALFNRLKSTDLKWLSDSATLPLESASIWIECIPPTSHKKKCFLVLCGVFYVDRVWLLYVVWNCNVCVCLSLCLSVMHRFLIRIHS